MFGCCFEHTATWDTWIYVLKDTCFLNYTRYLIVLRWQDQCWYLFSSYDIFAVEHEIRIVRSNGGSEPEQFANHLNYALELFERLKYQTQLVSQIDRSIFTYVKLHPIWCLQNISDIEQAYYKITEKFIQTRKQNTRNCHNICDDPVQNITY